MPDWSVRSLETPAEIEQVEELQRLVWPGDDRDVTPAHVLITAAHNGGLVLGAYLGERLIGMLFGFAGLYSTDTGWRTKHCSHQMGIDPDFRNLGIGFALKCAQAQIVRGQGLDLITWTYDPLLSANAHLNIARLGAVCKTYLRDAYGQMRDGLNAGLASDRFQVDWWMGTRRVEQLLEPGMHEPSRDEGYDRSQLGAFYEVSPVQDAALVRPPTQLRLPDEDRFLAEIPTDFLRLKSMDYELARAWRAFTRDMFESCFNAGYQVEDFVHAEFDGRPHSFYVLERTSEVPP